MIETHGLTYKYPSGSGMKFKDFRISKGEHWLLLGESGSGKTTLLHLLGGLLKSQAGSVRVLDADLTTMTAGQLDKFRGQHMGFIFQRNHLVEALSVENNLLLAPFLAGLEQRKERVTEVLIKLGLKEKENVNVKELSHGQAQRVAIGRALMNSPSIMLADEPTSSLDDKNCEKVIDLLTTVASESQTTLIIATHDQRLKSRINNYMQL